MRVLVCGGRDFTNEELLIEILDEYDRDFGISCVIEGDAIGADKLAGKWAMNNQKQLEFYPANWKEYGRAAGPIRNKQMIVEGKPDFVIAFPGGRGTANMIQQAKDANIEVYEV